MKPITLNELPAYSPWPARLLGIEPAIRWRFTARSPDTVQREFEEKYGPLLEIAQRNPDVSLHDLRGVELGGGTVVMNVGPKLCLAPISAAMEIAVSTHGNRIVDAALDAVSIVDLGCGYGYLLAWLRMVLGGQTELIGGDASAVAVDLAQILHRKDERLNVERFDFQDDVCLPLEHAQGPCVLVTSYALHQLPTAMPIVDLARRYRKKIATVITFEPDARFFVGDKLLGLMRQRYSEVNHYSADLLDCLRAQDDVDVQSVAGNAVGPNALLPGTFVTWRFH